MAKSELTIIKSLQELTNLRDALNMAIMAMEITAAGKEKHREEDPGASADDEPDPPSSVEVVRRPSVAKAKAAAKVKKNAVDAGTAVHKEVNALVDEHSPMPVTKEPPGKPKISVRDTIIGMVKAGTSISALEKMLDVAIKKAAPAGDIFEIRQAVQRFNLYDGDVKDILVAYDDHAEEAEQIVIGKDNQEQLPKSMQERVNVITEDVTFEGKEDEPVSDEPDEDDGQDPDDKF